MLPKLQPKILRTARHLPCFMSLFHPEGFPFACAIVHTCIVVAKGDGPASSYDGHVQARFAGEKNVGPTRVSTRQHCAFKVCCSRQFIHYRSWPRSINGPRVILQWAVSYFLYSTPILPAQKKHCTDWENNTSECNLHQP
jgi:hypothetical protein